MPEVRKRPQRAAILDVQQPKCFTLGQLRFHKRSERLCVHAALLRLPLTNTDSRQSVRLRRSQASCG